jgi:CTP synthase (UTP-ammonia lyase)
MRPTIAILGDHDRAVYTHREIDDTIPLLAEHADVRWVASDAPEAPELEGFDGIWVAPGSPYRDDDAVLRTIGHARAHGTPLLGICSGFQYLAVEYVRSVCGLDDAAHAEMDPDAADPVVALMTCALVGETRTIEPVAGTRFAEICGTAPFEGFHFCRFGLAEAHEQRLVDAGLRVGARARDAGVEAFELPGHPFFMATLFQPQIGNAARARLHPLLRALVASAASETGNKSLGRAGR